MAAGTYGPDPNITYLDANGLPLAGGSVGYFEAGTSTPLDTYNNPDLALIHVNPNPVVLNASGRSTQPVFFQVASYKEVVKDSTGAVLWTRDNIAAVSLTTSALDVGVWNFAGDPTSPCPTTQVALPSGATYDKLHAGTTIWPLDSANLVGDYVLQAMLMVIGVGSVQLSLVNLTDGSPDLAMVTVSSNSVLGELQQSATITFPAGGATKNYGVKIKNTGGVLGFAWGIQIVRKG